MAAARAAKASKPSSKVTRLQGQLDPNKPYEFYDMGQLVQTQPASSKIVVTGSGTSGNGEPTYNFRSIERDAGGENPSSSVDLTTSSPTKSPGGGQLLMQQQAIKLNFKGTSSFVVMLGAVWPGHDAYVDFANTNVSPNTYMNQNGDTVTLGANLFPPGTGHIIQFGVTGDIIASPTHRVSPEPVHLAPRGSIVFDRTLVLCSQGARRHRSAPDAVRDFPRCEEQAARIEPSHHRRPRGVQAAEQLY